MIIQLIKKNLIKLKNKLYSTQCNQCLRQNILKCEDLHKQPEHNLRFLNLFKAV